MDSCADCSAGGAYLFADYQLRRVRDKIGAKPVVGFENSIGETSLKETFTPSEQVQRPETAKNSGTFESSRENRQVIEKLRARNAEGRSLEAAHMAAAGANASGPDGRPYAIAGEFQVDASPVANDPQATIRKMRQIRTAAMSPSGPSSADRSVAARAAQVEAEARAEIAEKAEGNPARSYFKQPDDSAGTYFSAAA